MPTPNRQAVRDRVAAAKGDVFALQVLVNQQAVMIADLEQQLRACHCRPPRFDVSGNEITGP